MSPKILIALAALVAVPLAHADDLPFLQLAAHAGYRVGGNLEDSASGDSDDLDDGASLALALEFRFGSGFCRIIASGSTIFQAEALAGFAVSF